MMATILLVALMMIYLIAYMFISELIKENRELQEYKRLYLDHRERMDSDDWYTY